ncbi:hypothetical protein CYMTET_15899 [Cymbomonas tetramitiformis]|uniref:PiggyBac transposable element-derived protein domain-containing protein n=1 Tax=Cymbomonas tetramitiformis TaxID=36881 RepID=A0AAE0GDF7_9CHLO|nr:hypothetical protein CYMTET_15899 [Cymbomonas tetramitiformis]
MASEQITALEVADLIRRRVMTPGEVFPPIGKYAGRVFYGRITREYKKKGSKVKHVTIKYDDGDCIWVPIHTAQRWLVPIGATETPDGVLSDDLHDSSDSEESQAEPSDGEEENRPSLATDRLTPIKDRVKAESAEDKAQRIDGSKRKEETTATIGEAFQENKPTAPVVSPPFKHGRDKDLFEEPPDIYTPGLSKQFRKSAPKKVDDGMFYTFQKLLPPAYWRRLSVFSRKYATPKKAGTDVNSELDEKDRHASYEGKGKQRPWNAQWVSPDGLLLLHATKLLMVLNKRSSHEDHFSSDKLIRSIVADLYTLIPWEQTCRYFCPYDPDSLITDPEAVGYDPYAKYRLIMETLYDGIHSILCPPRNLSYDEGGKPWSGKGGHGVTVHFNPNKPNKRMTMCFMFAAFGTPFAWEFYTGKCSNEYSESKFNTAEERGFGITIARILRLLRVVKGTGFYLCFDNLFTSLFLLYILHKLYDTLATGTHRANNNLPSLSWGTTFEKGDTKWATSVYDSVPFTYLEYGDNKVVRFLSTRHSSPHENPGD